MKVRVRPPLPVFTDGTCVDYDAPDVLPEAFFAPVGQEETDLRPTALLIFGGCGAIDETEHCGIDRIKAVERKSTTFVPGIQCHPEAAGVRAPHDTSIRFFTAIAQAAHIIW